MAITRSEYITVLELQEILNDDGTLYPDDDVTTLKINEASETIKAHAYRFVNISEDDYTTDTAPNDLKLATAYQVKYNDDNPAIDDEYASGNDSETVGRTSIVSNTGESGAIEYKKIAPKSQRYLIQGNLIVRRLNVRH